MHSAKLKTVATSPALYLSSVLESIPVQTWKSNLQPHDGQLNRSENAADTDAFLHMGGA